MSTSEDKQSYEQILKSSGIVGGAQVIGILLAILRTKIAALLIGPLGYGIMSGLQAAIDMMRQASSLGIQLSAPKELSQQQDEDKRGRTLLILRRLAWYTGILGAILTLLLCVPLSQYAFGNDEYSVSIALLAITLVFLSLSNINTAILQGLRQLRRLAVVSLLGALLSTVSVIPLYLCFGLSGIVPAILVSAFWMWFISWLYTRKIQSVNQHVSFTQVLKEGSSAIKLGVYLVLTGFIMTAVMYSVRAFIVREMNIEAVGWFQAAWNVSNMYIWTILSAMGADFMPRMAMVHADRCASNKLINQQLEIAILVMSPILLMLIGGADIVIRILYSSAFQPSVLLLQWQLAGGIMTVFAWCLGIFFVADNRGHYSLLSESVWAGLYLVLVIVTWPVFGFLALGISYVVASVLRACLVYMLVRKIAGFVVEHGAGQDLVITGSLVVCIMLNILLVDGIFQYIVSFIIFVIMSIYCYKRLSSLINLRELIRKVIRRRSS